MTPIVDPPVPVAVALLAGGDSTRMGSDKRLLTLSGETLVERTLRLASELGLPILLAGGSSKSASGVETETRCSCGAVTRCADGPGRGPAAGLLGAAQAAPNTALFALACDLPLLSLDLLQALLDLSRETDSDILVPLVAERLHPLTAVYSPRALAQLGARVDRGLYGLTDWIKVVCHHQPPGVASPSRLAVRCTGSQELGIASQQLERELFNCNTQDDWLRAQSLTANNPSQRLKNSKKSKP